MPNYRTTDWYIEGPDRRPKRVYAVPVDYTEAVRWYKKAAAQGHYAAQNNLGVMYAHGLGVHADLVEAYRWMRLAVLNDKGNGNPMQTNLQRLTERMTAAQIAEGKARSAVK